jgi:hypothetical protein
MRPRQEPFSEFEMIADVEIPDHLGGGPSVDGSRALQVEHIEAALN